MTHKSVCNYIGSDGKFGGCESIRNCAKKYNMLNKYYIITTLYALYIEFKYILNPK